MEDHGGGNHVHNCPPSFLLCRIEPPLLSEGSSIAGLARGASAVSHAAEDPLHGIRRGIDDDRVRLRLPRMRRGAANPREQRNVFVDTLHHCFNEGFIFARELVMPRAFVRRQLDTDTRDPGLLIESPDPCHMRRAQCVLVAEDSSGSHHAGLVRFRDSVSEPVHPSVSR